MADWQVGDLALCVRGGRYPGMTLADTPRAGQVVTVERVLFGPMRGAEAGVWQIGSSELPPNVRGNHLWFAGRFIKVTPPETDAFDREVIDLMTRQPAKVQS
jgi:hypothetical protein